MRVQLLMAAGIFLASCAGEPLGHYGPKNEDTSNRDLYECEREAAFAGAGNKQQAFDNCMKARGHNQK